MSRYVGFYRLSELSAVEELGFSQFVDLYILRLQVFSYRTTSLIVVVHL